MASVAVPMRRQTGSMLLEGLIAVLIFSLGILAIVGMQVSAIRASSDAKYRNDASLLANELIGNMWVKGANVATLQTNFQSPSGTEYQSWLTNVQAALPGTTANPPAVVVDAAGIATITIFWQAPSDPVGSSPHQFVAIAQIRR